MDFNFSNFTEGKKQLDQAIAEAMKQSTLIDALSWLSVWDTERAVLQAKNNNFKNWETCSKYLFTSLRLQWELREKIQEATIEMANSQTPSDSSASTVKTS